MQNGLKVRNPRNECRYELFCNAVVLLVLLILAFIIRSDSASIGRRSVAVLYIADCGGMMIFMYLLEKYMLVVSGLYEKFIMTALAALYTFMVLGVINLIFFMSPDQFLADLALMFIKIGAVFASDVVLMKYFDDETKFKKPSLLIIDSGEKNFPRMKKIKYGVLNNYDAWYEDVEGMSTEELESYIKDNFPLFDAICIFTDLVDKDYDTAVGTASELNKDLFIVPKIIDAGRTNARIVLFDDILTLYMPKKSLNKVDLFLKRVADVVIAAVGLAIAAIPMALIALAIKITSPGPVFYKQVRLTRHKKEFEIYKFRTMIPDAEKLSGPKFAEKDDPRITPIGRLLRACRLDELPQIINILKGDMSVVGPRPERPVFVEQFENEIEYYDYRFEVKAGLTGLSHVYGRYSTYIYDRTYYDLFYITHYSLFLDFKIILLTTKTMFLKAASEGEDDFKKKTVAKAAKEEVKQ